MDLLDGVSGVAHVGGLAFAGGGAGSLEGPQEAHLLTCVLGCLHLVVACHGGDGGEACLAAARHEPGVSIGVGCGLSPRALTSGGRLVGLALGALGSVKQSAPLGRQGAEGLRPVGEHLVFDVSEGGDGATPSVSSRSDAGKVLLLGLMEDATHQVHASRSPVAVGVGQAAQRRPHLEDEGPHGVGNVVIGTMEGVDRDGPAIELLKKRMSRVLRQSSFLPSLLTFVGVSTVYV